MTRSRRRVLAVTAAAGLVGLFAWAAAGVAGVVPLPDSQHEGDMLEDLATLAEQVEQADVDQVESTPFRRNVVAGLHQHLNAVIWDGAEVDVDRIAYVVRTLDDHGAHQLSQEIERAMRLATSGRAWPAHDLLADMETRLSPPS